MSGRAFPLRAGTRGSPLALVQTREVIRLLIATGPEPCDPGMFVEHPISTTGDRVRDRRLAEIGGKGLFAKEIHEALSAGTIDFAVHSLKDLETELPPGIVLGCVLKREDPRDALILGPDSAASDPNAPFSGLPHGAVVGTSSVRRQAQLLHARPDLRVVSLRGNVQTRLTKLAAGHCAATMLALAGLRRLGLEDKASVIMDLEIMLPAACQGIVGITVRDDDAMRVLLAAIEDPEAKAASTAERAMLAVLDGSCRTPIGAYARVFPGDDLHLTGLVARGDGSFLLRRSLSGGVADAARIGAELGASLRVDSPGDVFG